MPKVKVYPGAKRPTHEISLSDGVQTFGLRLANGPRSIQEIPLTPSTVRFSGGGTKFGDWEPGMSHIEQRTWEGGRGQADFVDDPTRYADGKMAWTLTPGKLFPAPQWKFPNPAPFYPEGYQNIPGDVDWVSLYGDYRSVGENVTHSSGWSSYHSLWVWVRRVGSSGDLTASLKTDNGGEPGLTKASATLSISEVKENESALITFDLSGGSALLGTSSFITLTGNSTDDAANHWEVGVDADGSSGVRTITGYVWTAADFSLYYRVLEAGTKRKWRLFNYDGALYAVDEKAHGVNSAVIMNGDRGVATAGASTALTDSNKSWTADLWTGAYVKITRSTGAGQRRQITANTGTVLTVDAAWEINPSTDSEYVIYHTSIWQYLASTGGVCRNVCAAGDSVYIANGQPAAMRKFRWNPGASPPSHEITADGSNTADLLLTMTDASNDDRIYAADAGSAALARAAPNGYSGAALDFGSGISVGDSSTPIISLYAHDGDLFAFKPEGRYKISYTSTRQDRGKATASAAATLTDSNKAWTANEFREYYVKMTAGTGAGQVRKITANTATALTISPNWDTIPDTTSVYEIYVEDANVTKEIGTFGSGRSDNNGEAVLSYGRDMYISWGGYALLRVSDGGRDTNLSNTGPDRDEGLPEERKGRIVDLLDAPAGILAAVQGDQYSSVLVLPNESAGWHEIFRGWAAGAEIDRIHFQDSYRPRLWISIGGELVYQDWPRHTANPLKDPGMTYHHEAVLTSSTIDMGASGLPKLVKEISAAAENLASGIEVALDYQTNEAVGTDSWIEAGTFQLNPEDTLPVGEGQVYRIRFRLRLNTNVAGTPPIVHATVLEGFARTPVKYRWKMRVKVRDARQALSGVGYDHDPDMLLDWLKAAAAGAKKITMRSVWEQLDQREVIVEPPAVLRQFTDEVVGLWGGEVELSLREI